MKKIHGRGLYIPSGLTGLEHELVMSYWIFRYQMVRTRGKRYRLLRCPYVSDGEFIICKCSFKSVCLHVCLMAMKTHQCPFIVDEERTETATKKWSISSVCHPRSGLRRFITDRRSAESKRQASQLSMREQKSRMRVPLRASECHLIGSFKGEPWSESLDFALPFTHLKEGQDAMNDSQPLYSFHTSNQSYFACANTKQRWEKKESKAIKVKERDLWDLYGLNEKDNGRNP